MNSGIIIAGRDGPKCHCVKVCDEGYLMDWIRLVQDRDQWRALVETMTHE
jgi:hypothetical protein